MAGQFPTPYNSDFPDEPAGPPYLNLLDMSPEYPSLAVKLMKGGGAVYSLPSSKIVLPWDFTYGGLTEAQAKVLDDYRAETQDAFESFDFRHPRSGIMYHGCHMRLFEDPGHEKIWSQSRHIVIEKRSASAITTPDQITGCVAWAMALNNAELDGALVASMTDLSGAGAIIANSDPATQPQMGVEDGVRMISCGVSPGTGLTVTLPHAVNNTNCTVFMVARNPVDNGLAWNYMLALKGQGFGGLAVDGLDNAVSWITIPEFGSGIQLLGDDFKLIAGRADKNAAGSPGQGVLLRVNERQTFRTETQGSQLLSEFETTSSSSTVGCMELLETYYMSGDFRGFAIFDRALTDAEFETVATYFRITCELENATVNNLIIFDGDSLTSGMLGGGSLLRPYPDKVLLDQSDPFKAYNFGVPGQTSTQMLTDQTSQVLPLYDPALANNIIIAWIGCNDLAAASVVATLKSNYQAYCVAARAAGFKIVAVTLLPRALAAGTYEADRTTFNTWLRLQTFYDALADIAGDTAIGDAGDNTDETYYQTDHLHLNTVGYARVAGRVTTALNSLL
jgi:lysophospholipase L1-like esterase